MTKEGGGTKSVVDGYIAVTVFIAIVLGLLFGCLYAYLCRKRSRARNPHTVSNNNLGDNIQAIPLNLLKRMTNDFSGENLLGKGGFGTVYKGRFDEDITLAVKRMNPEKIVGKSSSEFKAEIDTLKRVIHRNIVGLAGYCLEENEKIIIYEYMPQGPLSRHLFNWSELRLSPLMWNKRLIIALDVAKGVEYLHHLAHQCCIHRDLKASNILLGSDMRAKVADFGLSHLIPHERASFTENRVGGTYGYMAPEYAVSGRVTTKVDVYSFGVILMELIIGKKVLDDKRSEDSMNLVPWFQNTYINDPDLFIKAIDSAINRNDETIASIQIVAGLANQCCVTEPEQRPDMRHVVATLSSLVDPWIPPVSNSQDIHGVDFSLSLPEALQKWKTYEGSTSSSSFRPTLDNMNTGVLNPLYEAGSSMPRDDKMKGLMLEEGSANKS